MGFDYVVVLVIEDEETKLIYVPVLRVYEERDIEKENFGDWIKETRKRFGEKYKTDNVLILSIPKGKGVYLESNVYSKFISKKRIEFLEDDDVRKALIM